MLRRVADPTHRLPLLLERQPAEADAAASNISSSGNSTDGVEVFSEFLHHPYPHQITSVMIGFMMVFRVQLSYQRYWEGIAMLYNMHTKWHDASIQIVAFDELSKGEAEQNGAERALSGEAKHSRLTPKQVRSTACAPPPRAAWKPEPPSDL